ncbi:unnamed protein product, partial [Mesorhabditis spiculigera]
MYLELRILFFPLFAAACLKTIPREAVAISKVTNMHKIIQESTTYSEYSNDHTTSLAGYEILITSLAVSDCICSPIVTGPPFGRVPDGIEDVCAPNTGFLGCKSNSNSPVADRELMRFRLYDESGNTIHDSGPYCSAEATKYATKSCECRTAFAKGATINAPFCKGVRTPYWTCTNYGYDPDRCGDI